jgi:hypothetical protein
MTVTYPQIGSAHPVWLLRLDRLAGRRFGAEA